MQEKELYVRVMDAYSKLSEISPEHELLIFAQPREVELPNGGKDLDSNLILVLILELNTARERWRWVKYLKIMPLV